MFLHLLISFLSGGMICMFVQIIIDKTSLTPARILTFLVVFGLFLGAAGLYQPFLKWAEAGASVPLTGFGNLLAKGVRNAIDHDGAIGILTGGFSSSAGGLSSAILCALVAGLLSESRM